MLKISGEALMGDQGFGLHPPTVQRIAREVKSVHDLGVEICMVIGGGNIFRGLSGSAQGMERTTADYMGMLATVMNALAMQSALEDLGGCSPGSSARSAWTKCASPTFAAARCGIWKRSGSASFAAGTGNPYFTTDTAATLRASEMKCEAIFKGTKVDGVYDKDPARHADAKRYDHVTFDDVLARRLGGDGRLCHRSGARQQPADHRLFRWTNPAGSAASLRAGAPIQRWKADAIGEPGPPRAEKRQPQAGAEERCHPKNSSWTLTT
ncbi:uridine monophosphate kinase [Jhaorihella thermophila]